MSIKFIEENQKGYARTTNKTFFCCLFLKPWFMEPNEQYTVLQNDAKFQIFILFYKPKMWDQRESLKINFWLQRLLWENSRFWHTQEIQFFNEESIWTRKKNSIVIFFSFFFFTFFSLLCLIFQIIFPTKIEFSRQKVYFQYGIIDPNRYVSHLIFSMPHYLLKSCISSHVQFF